MKTTKISQKTRILSFFLWLAFSPGFFISCDVMEKDPDVLDPGADVVKKEVYVMSQSTSVIDLNSIVKSNLPVRLSVTETTRKGALVDLGKGLLQYSPFSSNAKIQDAFEYTVFSESNEVIKTDSVVIIVENDSTNLPCGIFPVNDSIATYPPDRSPITINVLANDYVCNADSADVILSIYTQGPNKPPYFGTAEVVNNMIVYHPGNSYTGSETIIYTIKAPDGTLAYGFVYLWPAPDVPCEMTLSDDLYNVSIDSLGSSGFFLQVFLNDTLCDQPVSMTDEISIPQAPGFGSASIETEGIYYWPDDPGPDTLRIDTLRYKVCRDALCRQARTVIKIKNK